MDSLVQDFAGKTDGELIRSNDWNGLIERIAAGYAELRAEFGERLDMLEERAEATDARLDGIATRLDEVLTLADAVRQRYRKLDLSATRTRFAIGERAEVVARVANFDGSVRDFSNAAERPWIDFVSAWGSLKAAPGFTSRLGAGSRTVSVRVNAEGEARVLLRADHAEAFAEEEEQEVSAVLGTMVAGQSAAQNILAAATPNDTGLQATWQSMTAAYEQTDSNLMRAYMDTYYVANPQLSFQYTTPLFSFQWRDYHATVMAFVKPDSDPTTADAAQASGSIQVTFRDWIYPWIMVQYIPPQPPLVQGYLGQFAAQIVPDYQSAIGGIFEVVNQNVANVGLIGQQRQYRAAQAAMEQLAVENPPPFMQNLKQNAIGGLNVQQAILYSQSVSPAAASGAQAAMAVGLGGARGEIAAEAAATEIAATTDRKVRDVEARIIDDARAENIALRQELLEDGGVVKQAEALAKDARNQVQLLSGQIEGKADISLLSQILGQR